MDEPFVAAEAIGAALRATDHYPRAVRYEGVSYLVFDESQEEWYTSRGGVDVTAQCGYSIGLVKARALQIKVDKAIESVRRYEESRRNAEVAAARRAAAAERIISAERIVLETYGPPLPLSVRNRLIYIARLRDKETLQAIGDRWDLSAERVRQIVRKTERPRKFTVCFSRFARIRDFPGDEHKRGVWLTYGPSADPRLDNFYPVSRG